MSDVIPLPGPLRPETRDALLGVYRRWVQTGRAELPQPCAGRLTGQNVRSSVDTSEKMKINTPATMPT